MPSPNDSKFRDDLLKSENQMGFCVLTLLSWLAAADGNVDQDELDLIRQIAKAGGTSPSALSPIMEHAVAGNSEDLLIACEALRLLESSHKLNFLMMAVNMALADGYLTIPENHILRLLADALGLGKAGLNQIFREATGAVFPLPSDPSNPAWWDRVERKRKTKERAEFRSKRYQSQGIDLQQSLAILGLDHDACWEEVKKAYRRMAKVNHPDRYGGLGREAVEAATIRFRQIQAAYEYVEARMNHA